MKHDRDFTQAVPLPCPCCKQPVERPTFEVIREACDLRQQEAHVLEAIWYGPKWDVEMWPNRKEWAGPVDRAIIYNSMYRDDEDGGPSDVKMADQLKWAVFHLKNRLQGSGVGVEITGYRGMYRLIFAGSSAAAA